MKKTLFAAIFACFAVSSMAQEEKIVYDLYNFDYYYMNPAVAGAQPCGRFMLTDKHQWAGVDDAPNTQTFSARARILENVGIGGYVYRDVNGNDQRFGGQFTLAYHIPLSEGRRYMQRVSLDRQLSFGASIKINQRSFDFSDVYNNGDIALEQDNAVYPNMNVGVYYTAGGFFAGLSATNLINTNIDMLGSTEPDMPLTGFLFVGNSFNINDRTRIEPSIMVRANDQSEFTNDLNLKFSQDVNDDFSYYAQLSYRLYVDKETTQSMYIKPIIGLRYQKFNFGYACAIDLNKIAGTNYGTHEFMIGYTLCVPKEFCR